MQLIIRRFDFSSVCMNQSSIQVSIFICLRNAMLTLQSPCQDCFLVLHIIIILIFTNYSMRNYLNVQVSKLIMKPHIALHTVCRKVVLSNIAMRAWWWCLQEFFVVKIIN